MTTPDGSYEWLALIGAVVAVVAVLLLIWVSISLRRVRRAQKIVMGASERDVVAHASALQNEFIALRDWIDEASTQLDERMALLERRADGAISHTAMLRYDAFGAMSGKQSSSVALLDEHRNGVILSAITHRSHSHLYVKQLINGKSDIELSPEEQHVVELAFATPSEPPTAPGPPQPTRVVSDPSQAAAATTPPEPPGEPQVRQTQAIQPTRAQ